MNCLMAMGITAQPARIHGTVLSILLALNNWLVNLGVDHRQITGIPGQFHGASAIGCRPNLARDRRAARVDGGGLAALLDEARHEARRGERKEIERNKEELVKGTEGEQYSLLGGKGAQLALLCAISRKLGDLHCRHSIVSEANFYPQQSSCGSGPCCPW
jgi:hypothetical protein